MTSGEMLGQSIIISWFLLNEALRASNNAQNLNDKDHMICKWTLHCCFVLAHQTINLLLMRGLLSWRLAMPLVLPNTNGVTPNKTILFICGRATSLKPVIGHYKTPE